MENKDYRVVLVIGNGFDLDLGLKTKYNDYMNSDYFDRAHSISAYVHSDKKGVNLFNYLKEKASDNHNWIDIEKELADFAIVRKRPATDLEKKSFFALQSSLCSYIKDINYQHIDSSSKAIRLLKILKEYPLLNIISFNYTNLKRLEPQIGAIKAPIDYVHGSVLDNSIILGFEDTLEIHEGFSFMIKTFSSYYKSHNVRKKLLDADEIIFLGHSLGKVDYHYFEDLFKYQSQPERANQKLRLRIFTKDENSRISILLRLREMNNKRTDLLYDLCDFKIYKTENDGKEIEQYFHELKERLTDLENG